MREAQNRHTARKEGKENMNFFFYILMTSKSAQQESRKHSGWRRGKKELAKRN
jgi:hypothetical protein